MRIQYVHVLLVATIWMNLYQYSSDAATMAEQCSSEFEKVSNCLSFVTVKTETPSKECCSSVSDIRDTNPACLCFIILQTHNGSKQVKKMGIQESRLLQLPSACKLVNASVSHCPELLHIPKSSPDYAIFNSNATEVATAPSSTTPVPPKGGSDGVRPGTRHHILGLLAIATTAIFPYAFLTASL